MQRKAKVLMQELARYVLIGVRPDNSSVSCGQF
jgi:hypothetical protein